MEKVSFLVLAAALMSATACDEMIVDTTSVDINEIRMTMNGKSVIRIAGTGAITINWGDGTKVKRHTLHNYDDEWGTGVFDYYHNYDDKLPYTITINGANMTHLHCSNLASLDVSKNPALTHLYCTQNELTRLDVSKNLQLVELFCNMNALTSLDVSKNTKLTHLNCSHNQLTSLNVNNNTELTYLRCNSNQLKSLSVSKNAKLTYLYCRQNQLTSLNVNSNTELTRLACDNNQLTGLNVSNNPKLTDLTCDNNQLTSLGVSKNTALSILLISSNKLNNNALNVLFDTLHDSVETKSIYITGNPGADNCDRSIAANKGWLVY